MAQAMALVKVYSAADSVEAHFVRALLDRDGIEATVLGDVLGTALGGVPFTEETRPAVWVADAAAPAAQVVVDRYRHGGARAQFAGQPSWKCPNCGETIEPQFTECWKCGASRPEGEIPDEPAELPNEHLELDIPCIRCGYNLHGLKPTGRCPECGLAMTPSLLARLRTVSSANDAKLNQTVGGLLTAIADSAGCATSIILPLADAWRRAFDTIPQPIGIHEDQDLRRNDAAALTGAVIQTLCHDYQTEAECRDAFRRWGLSTARDLARALFVLIDQGLVEPTDRIALEDFSDAPLRFAPN